MKDLQKNIIFWKNKNNLNSDAEQILIFQTFFKNNNRLMSASLANDYNHLIFVLHLNSTCFCFFKKWYFFADLSFFEMKFCLRAILGIWLKIEDKILLDDCNHSPNLLTSSGCYFWKMFEISEYFWNFESDPVADHDCLSGSKNDIWWQIFRSSVDDENLCLRVNPGEFLSQKLNDRSLLDDV